MLSGSLSLKVAACRWGVVLVQTTRAHKSPTVRSHMKVNAAFSHFVHFPANLLPANLSWNLKNLICQDTSIIRSITVRASGRVQRARESARGLLGGEGVVEPGQLRSDGKTALWLGPHVGWNCPGQPRNQIINSDTRHSLSRLGLAWKFWYGSISNLCHSSQSPRASLICVRVYVKELRHPRYAVIHPPTMAHWYRRVDRSVS